VFSTSGQGFIPLGSQLLAVLILLPMIIANRFEQNHERDNATYDQSYEQGTGMALFLAVLMLVGPVALLCYIVYPSLFAGLQMFTPALVLTGAGVGLAVLGGALTLWSRFALGKNYVGGYTLHDDHQLAVHGPYRFVRHPMYIGFMLTSLGVLLATGNVIILLTDTLLRTYFMTSRVWREEMNLKAKIGQEYVDYQSRTGKFFPRLRRSATR
jgi:protein-S-isoprenylcysteine O-methyltransferase Ste14